jgi:hypothetical protein
VVTVEAGDAVGLSRERESIKLPLPVVVIWADVVIVK